jgi:hypothetical protein
MKISLIIISTLLTFSVFFPLFLFIYNGFKNTSNIKHRIESLIKNNGIIYTTKETWHHNFIGISNDNTKLTYVHFNTDEPKISTIDLTEIKECHILKSQVKEKEKIIRLKNLDLEFIYKASNKPNVIINFFNLDEDLSEDYELKRVEKWQQIIKMSLPEQAIIKKAS